MSEIVRPDYDNCILNIISSILKYYGVNSNYSPNLVLDEFLCKDYKNVVLMIFDGMGVDILERHLSEKSYLRSGMKQQITSVFPSTTTAAMTAYYSGLSPNEHGWLGWSLYFKEFDACIDTFSNRESFSKLNNYKHHAGFTLMPYKSVFQMIEEKDGSVRTYTVVPEGIKMDGPNINIEVKSVEQFFDSVTELSKQWGRKFIMSYWLDPDDTMHRKGCYNDEVTSCMHKLDALAEKMHKQLDDTLVIISADHGHTDITEEIFLNEIPDIDECLIMPPSMEPRAASLFIKPGMENVFEERFNNYFGKDFILVSKEMVFNSGLLGRGKQHRKVSDFIGNYLAIGITGKMLRYLTLTSTEPQHYKGHHAGLTSEEMVIPLIIID